jgi:type II secretory pathway pseudopilin PulG
MRRNATSHQGFVLLDVVLSLTILSLVVFTALRAFNQSISVAKRSDIAARAQMYAEAKMEEFSLDPPDEGFHEGEFADDPFYDPETFEDVEDFRWTASVEHITPEYPDVRLADRDEERLHNLVQIDLRVIHDDGPRGFQIWTAAEINTYLLGQERFSAEARRLNGLF